LDFNKKNLKNTHGTAAQPLQRSCYRGSGGGVADMK